MTLINNPIIVKWPDIKWTGSSQISNKIYEKEKLPETFTANVNFHEEVNTHTDVLPQRVIYELEMKYLFEWMR